MPCRNYMFLIVITIMTPSCGQSENRRQQISSGAGTYQTETGSSDQAPNMESPDNQMRSPTKKKRRVHIANENLLLAVISGWNSCEKTYEEPRPNPRGMNIYPHIQRLRQQIAISTGKEVDLFASCLRKGITEHTFYDSRTSRHIKKGDQKTLTTSIQQRAKELGARIILVGHSYGGWFAMRMTPPLSEEGHLAALVTVDPISPTRCQAKDLVRSLLGKSGRMANGCNSPLQNETEIDIRTIASNAGPWLNLWQRDLFNVLRSGPISEAKNIEIVHSSFEQAINGHIEMGKNPKTWARVLDWLDI